MIISQHDYTYDGMGNRLTHTEVIGTTTTPYRYVYDELNRLTEVRNNQTSVLIEGYTYDPLNNRLTKTDGTNTVYYIYDAANQLKEVRQGSIYGTLLASLGYDDNGNLTSKVEGSTTTSLTWDALNRLTQVTKTGISSQSYIYDDQGRRISKTVGSTTTNYLYNGPDIVGEYGSDWTPVAQYTHGQDIDDPILRATATAAQYFHQDGLGSVVGLSDQTGATTGTQRFDAWENKLASTGTIPLYGYTGREPDETGLIYYRARYYDASIGRLISRDPIGLRGGVNRYAYAKNNPANFNDPLGLSPKDPIDLSSGRDVMFNELSYASTSPEGQTSAYQGLGTQYAAADTGTMSDAGSNQSTRIGGLSSTQVSSIIFNEIRSLSGPGIEVAYGIMAEVIINGGIMEQTTGVPRPSTQPTEVTNMYAGESAIYNAISSAVDRIFANRRVGIQGVSSDVIYFILQPNLTTAPYRFDSRYPPAEYAAIVGPFNNSWTRGGLPATGVHINFYYNEATSAAIRKGTAGLE